MKIPTNLYLMPPKVKRTVNLTRVSTKNQVTLPVGALKAAHLKSGDQVRVEVSGEGRILLVREQDILDRFIGSIPGLAAAT
ncbi:MAG TPA: AbrB/MazE/SpoVT family DNA-binding domain-containing protein, partial [Candidatus Dormibacteraeota bacterium]|nr:AbrB/MazE/SpoVT family DNA-binding domain-containing protein [Candidatus Dormibacteraeota bacterium]